MVEIKGYEGLYGITELGEIISLKRGVPLKAGMNKRVEYQQVSLWKNNKGKTLYVHRLVAEHFIQNPDNKPEVNHIDGDRQNNKVENLEWVTSSENSFHASQTGLRKYIKKFTDTEYEEMLYNFLSGKSLTDLSQETQSSLTSLSYWVMEAAERLGLGHQYESTLKAQKQKRNVRANEGRKKAVNQLSLSGYLIASYPSLADARIAIGAKSAGPISNVIAGRQKTAYGFKWEFK
jgi:hypothetical protein